MKMMPEQMQAKIEKLHTGLRVATLVLVALAIGLTPAQAYTFIYACKDHGKTHPLKVDDTKNILTWKGTDYKITENGCGKAGWRAEEDGVGFDFCTATQGVADFELNGSKITCDMKR
ncbi:hypothetical protein [Bradyrhizobium sp. Leo121]|uniref:hypothetical protein n=1 Tax=Bradyrhizobium sp. Leo121 TaxID=1571195 RepID=UPI0010298380|nr:hypothetical protein [Bradyrhizobium sp. Leo121]RZN16130.1 hypothetical protein CWO90_40515 [Bradyrhizobium sp. Leo121]